MKPNTVWQVRALRRRIAVRVAPYRALLLAFSGGLDSTVLLDALTALRDGDDALDGADAPGLRAVHVHHGLSRHADRWAAHCANECRRRDVVLSTAHVVLDGTPEGLEAAARSARYQALAAILWDNEVLLTAQHQDDQAETLLLALKRGSGPTGLAAMAADAPFHGRRLVRPLLECGRAELEAYARARGLRWIKDDSNNDLRFDRNFLRLRILPLLRQRWPQFAAAVARSAQFCAKQERLLDELLEETLETLTLPDGSLRLTALTAMSDIRRAAVLRRWLASRGVRMPSHQQLDRLWHEVALSRRDAVAQIQLGDWQVRRFRNCLYVLPQLPALPDGVTIVPWPPQSEKLMLPAGLGILHRYPESLNSVAQSIANAPPMPNNVPRGRMDVMDVDAVIVAAGGIVVNTDGVASAALSEAVVRAPRSYERVSVRFGPVRGLLYITGRRRGRTLKKIWQELAIPPWRRSSTPMLFYNEQLIAALGVFVTWEGTARESEGRWHLFWRADSTEVKSVVPEDGGQDGVGGGKRG
ncbi:MAG: tRNA(Ile)-lysidine synthase [Sodalis sp.]|uniref:tRNA lysidine(34) synthetase TilS n=1 Tax=Sodalis sp. (in: enterobacteria) TaxID=1898979 RepID=UPI0038731241|nr:MAG: tRNA(Ile)-lysidine synthase [Sodalis sp.]